MLNPRTKGQTGEREIADMLNFIIYTVMKELQMPNPERGMTTIQRNQNQSAVGGSDLTNCMGLSIEVKRQEALSVGSWWKQTTAAAMRNNETPVLMYRQNRKHWTIMTYGWIAIGHNKHIRAVVEIDLDTFKLWFKEWARAHLTQGGEVRT